MSISNQEFRRPIETKKGSNSQRCGTPLKDKNVGQVEQLASMLVGGGLLAYGIAPGARFRLISLLAGASLIYRGASGHCELYQRLGVDTAKSEKQTGVSAKSGQKVRGVIHINRDRRDLYDLWRNLTNLPTVMRHLESVVVLDDRRSRWTARGPLQQSLQWDAEIIEDKPGELIAWQSLPGSQVDTAGSVHFNSSSTGEGTDLTVAIKYDPPGGVIVATLADWFGQGLQHDLNDDLRRFKQLMETGEVATAAVQPV